MTGTAFVGDINVDAQMLGMRSLPVIDGEVTCRDFELTIGSSTMIAACAYACLGGRALAFGLVGRDYFGDFMIRRLRELGVDTGAVRASERVQTGITVNLVYESTRTQVTYPGSIRELREADLDLPALLGCRHAHFGGIYLQDGLRDSLAGLLERLKRAGLSTSLDPQWDQSGQWLGLEDWLPRLDWFFVKEKEARSITGCPDPEQACLALAERTACPVVKLGAAGALFAEGGRLVHVPARRIEVVDTTGAGDSFDAGFLYAVLERGLELEEAARFAAAAGTRCCLFRGGVEARSTFQDIQEFLRSSP